MKETDRNQIKAGDQAIIYEWQWRSRPYLLVTVERVTPTQIIANGDRFRKSDGMKVGGYESVYGRPYLFEATEENLAEMNAHAQKQREQQRRKTLVRDIVAAVQSAETDQLEQIAQILELEATDGKVQ